MHPTTIADTTDRDVTVRGDAGRGLVTEPADGAHLLAPEDRVTWRREVRRFPAAVGDGVAR